jgi:lipopolysaccharide export system protein LptA
MPSAFLPTPDAPDAAALGHAGRGRLTAALGATREARVPASRPVGLRRKAVRHPDESTAEPAIQPARSMTGSAIRAARPAQAQARRPLAALAMAVWFGLAWALAAPALAERADRQQPLIIEAERPGIVDLQRQVVIFSGNVIVAQGSMVLRADRVELRETADGYRSATAIGSPAGPATWRQRRDAQDETVEGSADRIEFDSRADTLRFVGNGAVRRLRGSTVADEISGAVIQWDNLAEVFSVEGEQATPTNPGGRVRVILSPRGDGAEPGSAPATDAPPAPPAAPPLEPSRSLGGPR